MIQTFCSNFFIPILWRLLYLCQIYIPVNCPYLIVTVPILTPPPPQKKKWGEGDFIVCPYFCKHMSIEMYMEFRNVPIFKIFLPFVPISLVLGLAGMQIRLSGNKWLYTCVYIHVHYSQTVTNHFAFWS